MKETLNFEEHQMAVPLYVTKWDDDDDHHFIIYILPNTEILVDE